MSVKFLKLKKTLSTSRPPNYKYPLGLNSRIEVNNVNLGISATGGTKTSNGSNVVHVFTSPGSFVPSFTGEIEYVVVAGGGGSGGLGGRGGAGGGGGGFRTGYISVTSGTPYPAVIGAGGAGGPYPAGSIPVDGPGPYPGVANRGSRGGNTSFSSIISTGGGGGGAGTQNQSDPGNPGGSGGAGQGASGGSGNFGNYSPPEGNPGGSVGGGAGSPGDSSGGGRNVLWVPSSYGTSNSSSALSARWFAGGGTYNPTPGPGGGGADSTAGTINTGGGGGGSNPVSGGSGVVLIRYDTHRIFSNTAYFF